MNSIYVQAGLYAEGPSDYAFLIPLLERVLDDLLAREYPGRSTVLPTPLGLDVAENSKQPRDAQIAAVIQRFHDTCQLFVIHADADGDAIRARKERVEPGARRGLSGLPHAAAAAACVPVHMTEAWMLADAAVFHQLLRTALPTEPPDDPERVRWPKQTLQQLLSARRHGRQLNVYEFFGNNINLAALRRLEAFRAFEDELVLAVREIAGRSR